MSEENDIFEEKIDEEAAKNSAEAAQENHAMYQNATQQDVIKQTVMNGAALKPATYGFGVAALVLGILSLLCFCTCCINIPLSIAAIIFAIIQLVESSKELSRGITPSKAAKGMSIAGIVTAVLSVVLMIWMFVGISKNSDLYKSLMESNDGPAYYENFFNEIYGEDNPYTDLFNQLNEQLNEL